MAGGNAATYNVGDFEILSGGSHCVQYKEITEVCCEISPLFRVRHSNCSVRSYQKSCSGRMKRRKLEVAEAKRGTEYRQFKSGGWRPRRRNLPARRGRRPKRKIKHQNCGKFEKCWDILKQDLHAKSPRLALVRSISPGAYQRNKRI